MVRTIQVRKKTSKIKRTDRCLRKTAAEGFSTDYDYDVFADSVIKCAYGDMTLEDLEAVYYGLTTPFF